MVYAWPLESVYCVPFEAGQLTAAGTAVAVEIAVVLDCAEEDNDDELEDADDDDDDEDDEDDDDDDEDADDDAGVAPPLTF